MWVYSDWSRVYRVLVNAYIYIYMHVQVHVSPMAALPSDKLCSFSESGRAYGEGRERNRVHVYV